MRSPLPFRGNADIPGLTGILNTLTEPLKRASVPIYALSTWYDRHISRRARRLWVLSQSQGYRLRACPARQESRGDRGAPGGRLDRHCVERPYRKRKRKSVIIQQLLSCELGTCLEDAGSLYRSERICRRVTQWSSPSAAPLLPPRCSHDMKGSSPGGSRCDPGSGRPVLPDGSCLRACRPI